MSGKSCPVCGAEPLSAVATYCGLQCRNKAKYARLVTNPARFAQYQAWREAHGDSIRTSERLSKARAAAKARLQLRDGETPTLGVIERERVQHLRRLILRAGKQQLPVQLTHEAQITLARVLDMATVVL